MDNPIKKYKKNLEKARKAYRKNPTHENQIARDNAWLNLMAVKRAGQK